MSPLILCWVGPGYEASVRVGRLLSAVFLFSFVASPAGMLILAREQTRLMNFVSVVLASVYWGGVLLTLRHLGIDGFAYMKLISFSVCVVIYWVVSTRLLRLRSIALVNRLILPILPAVAVVTALSLVCLPYMPHAQGKVNLLLVGLNVSLAALVGMAVNIAFSPEIRTFIREVGKPLLIRSFQPSQS
jgi:O-antigen/teichoic acid export membrane protein